jgi:hypothetical protein
MGINDEYSRDAHEYQLVYSDDDSDDFDSQLDPEDWEAVYSQELLNGWMTIRAWLDTQYLHTQVAYPVFVEFVLNPSPWFSGDEPDPVCVELWKEISKIDVIQERVVLEQFTGWFDHYFSTCVQ